MPTAHTGGISVDPNLNKPDIPVSPTSGDNVIGIGVADFSHLLPEGGTSPTAQSSTAPNLDQIISGLGTGERPNITPTISGVGAQAQQPSLSSDVLPQTTPVLEELKRQGYTPKVERTAEEIAAAELAEQKKKKKARQSSKRESISEVERIPGSKEFKKPSKKKHKNPAKTSTIEEPIGPAIPLPENARGPIAPPLQYGGELPINAIVKANLDNHMIPVSRESRLAADPDRPRVVIGPGPNPIPAGDGTTIAGLLPGQGNNYTYYAGQAENDDKRTEAERISDAITGQVSEYDLQRFHPHSVSFEENRTSFEEYVEDYNQGLSDEGEDLRAAGRYGNLVKDWAERARAALSRIIRWYNEAYIPLESEHIDENGYIRFDDKTEEAIVQYMNLMGYAPEERYLVFQQAIKALGLSPDRDGLFFKRSQREKISDEIFIETLGTMITSCRQYGHPYGFVNKGRFLGGTRCYPIGVMTYHEAKILCSSGHRFAGQDPWELMSRTAETWRNETLPAIRKNIYRQEGGEAQMNVLMDMVRAICSLDAISPRIFGVSETIDRGYEQMISETMPGARENETEEDRAVAQYRYDQLELQRRRQERALDRLDRKRNRRYEVYADDVVDENGKIIHNRGDLAEGYFSLFGKVFKTPFGHPDPNRPDTSYVRDPKARPLDSLCMASANLMRFAGVVGYIPIMGSGIVEHAQGNLNTIIANRLLFGDTPLGRNASNDDYRPNAEMYALIESPEGLEAIAAMKAIYHVGGMDALLAYYSEALKQENAVLNAEHAKKFLDEYVKRESSKIKVPAKLKQFTDWAGEAAAMLMPGDKGSQKADARRWLEGFMLNNMWNADSDRKKSGEYRSDRFSGDADQRELGFTSSQVLEMMEVMGPSRFLAAMTSMNAGRDALVMMRNQTFDRISPLGYAIDSILRSNGITNLAVTVGIDTYFSYGVNLVQLMIPFSNTFSYCAVKGVDGIFLRNGVAENDRPTVNILDYQLGGHDPFFVGLRKNLIYDCVKLGNICLIAGFMAIVIGALGFDEPEDEGNKYAWSEYRIGRNLNLGGYDENGNPTGIPIYAAWWLNDLTMFALPLAYSINAMALDQKLYENDPELPTKLFFEGCYDMLSGCSLLDCIKAINNAERDLKTYEKMMTDPDVECPPDWMSYALMEAELMMARGFGKLIPNALKSLRTSTVIVGNDALDHTAYYVYDRGSSTPGKTIQVEDWFELQRRIESKYNPIYAVFNNFTKNGYFFDDGSTGKTGYLFDEMPIATMAGRLSIYWMNKYDYDPDNIPGGEQNRIPYTEKKIEEVLEDIGRWNSVEEAIANGYRIPASLRFKMRDYCYQRINFEENLYNQRVQSGYYGSSAERQDAYTKMSNNKQYWYNILNNWVFNSDIPWNSKDYAKLLSDYYEVFYFKDTGAPATRFDYWTMGDDIVEQRFVLKGNHPKSSALFTTPETNNRGYNYETIANFYTEGESGTNSEAILKMLQDDNAVVAYGRDEGVPTATALFGGNPSFKTNEPIFDTEYNTMIPTENTRAYVPYDETALFDLPNVNVATKQSGEGQNASQGSSSSSRTSSNSGNGNGSGNNGGSSGSATNAGNRGGVTLSEGSNITETQQLMDELKSTGREDVGADSSMGEMGVYYDKTHWADSSTPNWANQNWPSYGVRSYSSGGSSPRIYSTSRSVNADRPSTMYSKNPQSPRTTYLNPSFETKGSREAYKRQDI